MCLFNYICLRYVGKIRNNPVSSCQLDMQECTIPVEKIVVDTHPIRASFVVTYSPLNQKNLIHFPCPSVLPYFPRRNVRIWQIPCNPMLYGNTSMAGVAHRMPIRPKNNNVLLGVKFS